ncbi:MAG: hypothetical protein ACQBVK_01160 [Candidatus Phytoplasma sp. TWB_XP]
MNFFKHLEQMKNNDISEFKNILKMSAEDIKTYYSNFEYQEKDKEIITQAKYWGCN